MREKTVESAPAADATAPATSPGDASGCLLVRIAIVAGLVFVTSISVTWLAFLWWVASRAVHVLLDG